MAIRANEYVAINGLGVLSQLRELLPTYAAVVRGLNVGLTQRRATFEARILLSEDDVENEFLELDEVTRHTAGAFPILWANLTFDPERLTDIEIREIEQQFSFRLLGTIESDSFLE